LSVGKLDMIDKVCASLASFASFPQYSGKPSRGGRLEKYDHIVHAIQSDWHIHQWSHSFSRLSG
jgi:hypothetical protein